MILKHSPSYTFAAFTSRISPCPYFIFLSLPQELRQFAKHVVRKFFEVAGTNKKVYMELFFWKNLKESTELTEGYGSVAE